MIPQIAKETTIELRSQIAYRKFQELLLSLIERGGPTPQEYASLSHAIRDLGDEVRARAIPTRELRHVMKKIAIEHFQDTMQAASILKKHGYSGDFEIIDDIYQMRIAEKPCLRKWDLYFHAQAAPCAVRNRKSYFHQLLRTLSDRCDASQPRVLNIASGPARDMREWFDANPDSRIHFDCIELDTKAIAHANSLCAPYLDRMHYHHQNALNSFLQVNMTSFGLRASLITSPTTCSCGCCAPCCPLSKREAKLSSVTSPSSTPAATIWNYWATGISSTVARSA